VRLGAIIVIGGEDDVLTQKTARWAASTTETSLGAPLACVEVVGQSAAERMIERFLNAEVEVVTVLLQAGKFCQKLRFRGSPKKVAVEVVADVESSVVEKLKDYSQSGIEHSFIVSADAYAETDLLDFFYFHRESRQTLTRTFTHDGPLPFWIADCAKAQQYPPNLLRGEAGRDVASYFIRGYVNRLAHPRDLRRLASDILCGCCDKRPSGREISPKVWVDQSADVHRNARIVGPAYIGCGSKVSDNVLITRFSSIERECYVDCGTVIEGSSILANTHIGIWLDVCHAVISGNKMWSLDRDVMVEISDPRIMRPTASISALYIAARERHEAQQTVAKLHKPIQRPVLGNSALNLIQE
jgi:carbonic anhydrase/acetyltransferase-like protein (isoleucine patch superfamily)